MIRRTHTALAPAKWARLSALVAAVVILFALGWTRAGRAASPTSGTLTTANTGDNPVTYTAGPFTVANATGLAALQCNAATQCDEYKLKVDVPDGLLDTKQVRVTVQWANSAADFDATALLQKPDGTPGQQVASSGTSADPEVMILPAVKADYVIRVVPFNPLGQSITTKIIFEDKPNNFTPGTGAAPQYVNYPATGGLGTDSGEPSLGVNWKTGNAMFIAGLQTLRIKFDNTVKPARATWEDKSATLTSLATTDPILYTDSRAGRTIVSQLTGSNSLSAFTDDDGESWTPNEGGPLTSGVDHQTVGGGPYAPPLSGGTALYPNAVYYCSQDLYTAFCARSDDGGLTYGPTVPMYTLECGGIHGHVKVAPDGTVYMPNRQCGTNQGVAVSEDNGISWMVRKVADSNPTTASGDSSPGDWDPSVGVGSDGTLYFGYDHADGRPHVAVSYDKGQSWVTDQAVGRDLNLRDSAFPAVVAGDGNRAAFAFLGTTELGGSQAAVWHLYVSTTYDRGRSWTTTDATPNDPVQLGTICSGGLSCGADRNMLDFMDAQIDAQGRVLVGYADGCVGCSSPATSRSKLATIARLQCGRGLLSQFDSVIGDCVAPTPTPAPTAAPTPVSYCDGTNLVADAAGDAKNPAPGAQGPTDQADITSVSFAKSGTNIVTKLTLKNLSATPSPGSTFTSYFVSWKAPNGTRYASQADVDASGLVFYSYGAYDGSQLSSPATTTGTFNPGASGTITVDVPLAGVGNPSVPTSNPDQAAVSEPAAATVAGSGVLGAGLVFTTPMDTANANVRWAVCATAPTPTPTATPTATPTPSTTPTPSNDPRCAASGVKVLDDPAADNTGGATANQSQDIRSISIGEQYSTGGTGQLVVTMKVTDLTSTLTPNASWKVAFDGTHADGTKTTYFVSVANNSAANPTGISYNYGFVDTTKNNLNSTVGTADSGSTSASDDTLTVVLALNKLNKPVAGTTGATLTGAQVNLSAGKTITGVAGTTSVLVGVAGNGLNSTIDTTATGTYTMAGAATCPAPAGTPTPTPAPNGSATAPRFVNYVTPAGVAESAGEPSIGVNWKSERTFSNSNGAVANGGTVTYFGGFLPYMLRATFDDSVSPSNVAWDQAPLTVANAPRVFGDPILFTDSKTGRTFVSQELGLTPLGSTMEFTDDDGRSFRPSEGSGAPSGVDHQTVGGGAYHQPLNIVTNPLYPNAVYYCSQALEAATCSLSVDGGMTFGPGVPIYTALDCGGIHGHVKVAPDGTVYVPNRSCGGKQGLAVSQDNGISWKVYRVPDSVRGDTDPSVGIATDGAVYFGYEGSDGHARVSVSRNNGQSWSDSVDVGAPLGLQNIIFPAVVAGDGNRAAFAFHGTTTAGSYNDPAFPGVWYLYVASTTDGGKTWTTTNVTPNDPVQRGAVCTAGVNCTSTNGVNTRNLLDFFGAEIDKRGRVLVGYVDGCVGSCVQGGANSGAAKAVIARQSGGARMFAAYDPPAASAPSAPAVAGSVSGATVSLSWSTPDNGGSAITGYKIARRDGATVTPLASVTTNTFSDPGYSATAQSVYRVTALNANGEGAYKEFNPAGGGASASPCVQPGVLVVSDVNNDGVDLDGNQNTPPDASVNIKGVYVAEPYMGAGVSKLVFTLKVAPSTTTAVVPPSTQWFVMWNRPVPDQDFDRWYVAMKSDAASNLSFEYGKMGVATNTSTSTLPPPENPNTNQTFKVGAADGGSYDPLTGTITITLSTSKAEGIGAGSTLKGVNARTFFARPDAGVRNQAVASDITGDGTYTLAGNNSCASASAAPAPAHAQRQGSFVEVAWASVPAALTRWAVGLAF